VITAEGTTLERNINFEAGFMPCGSKVYEREYNFSNTECAYSDDIQEIEKLSNTQ
jgi:hypothetical protein